MHARRGSPTMAQDLSIDDPRLKRLCQNSEHLEICATPGGPDATASGFRRNKRFFLTDTIVPDGRLQREISQSILLSLRDPDV